MKGKKYKACIPFGSHSVWRKTNGVGSQKNVANYWATFAWLAVPALIAGLITTATTIGFSAAKAQEEQAYDQYPFLHHLAAALTLLLVESALFGIPNLIHRFGPGMVAKCRSNENTLSYGGDGDEDWDIDGHYSLAIEDDETTGLLVPHKKSGLKERCSPFHSATPTKTALWFLVLGNLILGTIALSMSAEHKEAVGAYFAATWTSLVDSPYAHGVAVGELIVGLPLLSGSVGVMLHAMSRGFSTCLFGPSRATNKIDLNVQDDASLEPTF